MVKSSNVAWLGVETEGLVLHWPIMNPWKPAAPALMVNCRAPGPVIVTASSVRIEETVVMVAGNEDRLKTMLSGPGLALASAIACRREPAGTGDVPSAVVVTVKVAAERLALHAVRIIKVSRNLISLLICVAPVTPEERPESPGVRTISELPPDRESGRSFLTKALSHQALG